MKINTFLSVGPRDRRGYHPLRTVFQAIGLFDTLTVSTDGTPGINCDWPDFPIENTLTKTLRLLQEIATFPPLSIHLSKSIPAKSGLGGGSSDAAGLIRAVSRLVGGGIPVSELKSIALAVGADVPFFLVGGRALGEGYGQRLRPLDDEPAEWLVIAVPEGVSCSTREMFGKLDESERDWRDFPVDEREVYNDFLSVAPPECRQLIQELEASGATRAGLSGSGSACFGFFPGEWHANKAAERLAAKTWVAQTLTRAESLRITG